MSSTSAAEPAREFVDSNVLVYSVDLGAGQKALRAAQLLDDLWSRRAGCLSVQVLQEFFVAVTTRLPRSLSLSQAAARVTHFSQWNLHAPGAGDLIRAIELQRDLRISFWDAMIVHSARRMECGVLWTEDLKDGQRHAGVLVRNPFAGSVME
jgi:predicted nucleic acid-binding protein